MSAKTVAVPLIRRASLESAVRCAFLMARAFNGHVVGLHAPIGRDVPVVQEYVMTRAGLGLSGEDMRRIDAEERQDLAREAESSADDFFALAKEMRAERVDRPPAPAGLSASFKALDSGGLEALAADCRVFDMVVVGQPGEEHDHLMRKALKAMLFTAGRPVLMAPRTTPETLGEVVMIAWNGSLLSARAAAVSRQHFQRARRVGIVTARGGIPSGPSAGALAEYLAWHGIEASVVEADPGGRPLGEALLGAAGDFGADLLVMGAYAHTAFREALTGGVTNHVLSHARIPVFMAH